jgi:choline transport protein
MENPKSEIVAHHRDSESQHDGLVSEKKGTEGDQRDMYRMGKQQELRRNFRFVSIFGYSMVLMATWETILTYVHFRRSLTLSNPRTGR